MQIIQLHVHILCDSVPAAGVCTATPLAIKRRTILDSPVLLPGAVPQHLNNSMGIVPGAFTECGSASSYSSASGNGISPDHTQQYGLSRRAHARYRLQKYTTYHTVNSKHKCISAQAHTAQSGQAVITPILHGTPPANDRRHHVWSPCGPVSATRPPAAAASGVPADLQAAAKNVPWEGGLRAASAAVAFPRPPSRPRARFSLFPDRVASPLGSGSSQPGGAVVRWPGLPGVAVHYALAGATCQVQHAMAWRMRHVSAAARTSTSARQLAPPCTASETARLSGPVSHRDTLFAVVRAATLRSAV